MRGICGKLEHDTFLPKGPVGEFISCVRGIALGSEHVQFRNSEKLLELYQKVNERIYLSFLQNGLAAMMVKK